MTNIILGDPVAVIGLVGSLGFLFACGYISGRLSTKHRR